MENVKTWQWLVIAGPAFMAGGVCAYWILKGEINAMRVLILADEPKKELTSEEIADNMMGILYDHR
jgi:hypothetical protein